MGQGHVQVDKGGTPDGQEVSMWIGGQGQKINLQPAGLKTTNQFLFQEKQNMPKRPSAEAKTDLLGVIPS